MASYITRTGGQKKKNILCQKELALRGDLRRAVSTEKLQRSAEKVRQAQLAVIKALINEVTPARSEDEEDARAILRNLNEAKERWQSILIDDIIDLYSGEDDGTAVVDRKKWWDFRPR